MLIFCVVCVDVHWGDSKPNQIELIITRLFHPNQLPDTYLMAFFSPRPRAESGVSAVSTPGLFLFPWSQTEKGRDDEENKDTKRLA